jgi:hypothetical protein
MKPLRLYYTLGVKRATHQVCVKALLLVALTLGMTRRVE